MVKLDPSAQEKILNQILTQSLNVSQTEERIETYLRIKSETKNNDSVQPNYDAQKILARLTKDIAKLEEKYGVSLNKEEEEGMESIVVKVTVPRYI